MFFWYERTPGGQWAANLSPESPPKTRAEGKVPRMSEIWVVPSGSNIDSCANLHPPPDDDDGALVEPSPDPAPRPPQVSYVDIPEPAVIYAGVSPDGHILSLYGVTSAIFDHVGNIPCDEPFLIWLRRVLPRQIAIIDLSGEKVDREGLIANPQ